MITKFCTVQTGFGAHPASYSMGNRVSFPGVKRPKREADHSPPYSAVNNEGAMQLLPLYAFIECGERQLYLLHKTLHAYIHIQPYAGNISIYNSTGPAQTIH